jgi:hypothetical protein
MNATLTSLEAFKAMRAFLEEYYFRTLCDDVGVLLGSSQLFDKGGTWDPALWGDWEDAGGSQKNLTVLQAYKAMLKFLEDYASRGSAKEFKDLIESMQLMPQGGTCDPERWEKWLQACNVELKNDKQ